MKRTRIKMTVPESRTDVIQHGRNFIRANDLVRVGPSQPGKRDGFRALFKYAETDKGGLHYCLLAVENVNSRLVGTGFRFMRPERVRRTATTHDPRRR